MNKVLQSSGWHYVPGVTPIQLLILTIIVAIALWTWFRYIDRGKFRPAVITILVITILSLFAFGVRVENGALALELNIPEVCAIFVLFFLSELAVHLTARIEGVAADTGAVAKTLEDVRGELISGDLVKVANSLARTLPVADLIGQLTQYGLNQVMHDCVVLQNARIWVATVRTAMEQRQGDPIHAACWKVLIKRYMAEEETDLKNRLDLDGVSYPNPQIATNDRLYLDMLRELAAAAAAEPFRKSDRVVQFLAITHLLPSWYYNWKHSDGEYAFPAMEGFRKTVVDIVRQSRAGATFRYRRLCLVTDNDVICEENAIPKRATLLDQYDLFLLTPNRQLAPDAPAEPTEARLIKALKTEFSACASLTRVPSELTAHLILTQSELNQLTGSGLVARVTNGTTVYSFTHGQQSYTLWSEKLLDRFINSMHTAPADSEVGLVNMNDLQGLPNDDDHDLLMVGYEENGTTEWEFAISTNMTPGHQTMLIHLVHDKELLRRIAAFYTNLQRAPLSQRDAVVNLA